MAISLDFVEHPNFDVVDLGNEETICSKETIEEAIETAKLFESFGCYTDGVGVFDHIEPYEPDEDELEPEPNSGGGGNRLYPLDFYENVLGVYFFD